jgi:lipid A 3-O-deacylase
MKLVVPYLSALCAAALGAAPARADEIFGGLYAHDVRIIAVGSPEHGPDFELGWRGGTILRALGGPQPHLLVSVNGAGGTHFAAAGISWRIGRTLYVRPGIGIAVHSGAGYPPPDRIWFNSRVLFEPEIGVGLRLTPRASVEASWVHLSHAQIFGHQNPGLDTIGMRFNYRFR